MYNIKNILVTTDFSDYSAGALDYALSLADAHQAEVHLIHVVEPRRHSGKKTKKEVRASAKDGEEKARRKMQKFIYERVDEYTSVKPVACSGQPAQEIVRYARDHDVDVIVIATHGRTGLAHALMGSIAEKVVRYSPVPVLAVKTAAVIEKLITEEDILESLHISSS